MGYDHSMMFVANVDPGTRLEQVVEIFAPYFDYMNENGMEMFGDQGEHADCRFTYDQEAGEIDIYTCGEVSYSFPDLVEEIAANLSKEVIAAGEIWLYDHNTGDIDNAKSVYYFGPSDDAIRRYKAENDTREALALLSKHLPESLVQQIGEMAKGGIPAAV